MEYVKEKDQHDEEVVQDGKYKDVSNSISEKKVTL